MAAGDVIGLRGAQQHLNMDDREAGELAVHVSAASELVEQMIGPVVIRQFVDYERCGPRIALDHRPVVELVSVVPTFGGAAVDAGSLRVHPTTGSVRSAAGGLGLLGGPFDISYRAGRVETLDAVPGAIALACRVIVAHLWETQRAVQIAGPGLAPEDFTSEPVGAGYAIPYRARDLLAPYMTPVVV